MRPIFLLSIPRSGSTLLQRILGSHSDIATGSEPHFLLPYLYSIREKGVCAEYDHHVTARGIRGFSKAYYPGGLPDYLSELHDLTCRLYDKAAGGRPYFLDKTPRYGLIVNEIMSLFPEGRFIFLWRKPVATVASLMETFSRGRWELDKYSSALYCQLPNLIAACEANPGIVCSIRYEDLIQKSDSECERLLRYLELPVDHTLTSRFADLPLRNRRFWDPTGTERYKLISQEPLDSWKTTMANPVRKAWVRRYLNWLGQERLSVMGYDLATLREEIDALPTSLDRIGSDIFRIAKGWPRRRIRSWLIGTPQPMWLAAERR